MDALPANQVKIDLAFEARMPGCYPALLNDAAIEYFAARQKTVGVSETKSLCDVLGAPPTPLMRFCPLESTYRTLTGGDIFSGLHTFACWNREDPVREYDLFLFYARRAANASMLHLRFLPFPTTLKLRVTSHGKLPLCSDDCKLNALDAAVTVEVENMAYQRKIAYRDLMKAGVGDDIVTVRCFLNEVLIGLDRWSPRDAWSRAAEGKPEFGVISAEIPDPLKRRFICESVLNKAEAAQDILVACGNGLDAPALMTFAFHDILERIRGDRDLALAPNDPGNVVDQRRYYRLHVPLLKLVQQDRYIGWLPMDRAYRHERTAVLDQLYGHSDSDVATDT